MPNPPKQSPRQFPTVAVVVPRMQVPSTAAPPQGSDPSKSKNVKPDPVNNTTPSTTAPSNPNAMSNSVNPVSSANVAASAVRPQPQSQPQPQRETNTSVPPVVVDSASSAEISESEMQLVSSLAKLQKLEATVCIPIALN